MSSNSFWMRFMVVLEGGILLLSCLYLYGSKKGALFCATLRHYQHMGGQCSREEDAQCIKNPLYRADNETCCNLYMNTLDIKTLEKTIMQMQDTLAQHTIAPVMAGPAAAAAAPQAIIQTATTDTIIPAGGGAGSAAKMMEIRQLVNQTNMDVQAVKNDVNALLMWKSTLEEHAVGTDPQPAAINLPDKLNSLAMELTNLRNDINSNNASISGIVMKDICKLDAAKNDPSCQAHNKDAPPSDDGGSG